MQIKLYTPVAQRSIIGARELASKYGHVEIQPEHLLRALLAEPKMVALLNELGGKIENLPKNLERFLASSELQKPGAAFFNTRFLRVASASEALIAKFNIGLVDLPHLLLGILSLESDPCAKMLISAQITDGLLREHLFQTVTAGGKTSFVAKDGSAIKTYTIDLTAKARMELLGPIIGRDEEIRRAIQTICRGSKNNPILVGQPGVGRTSIIHGLACRIASGDVPPTLKDKRILTLDISSMLAGATLRGQFEERVKNLMNEVKAAGKQIILYVEEVQNIVAKGGEGGGNDPSALIKPALSRGEVQIIGSTTLDEYRSSIEKDRSLERRFQQILVEEPSEEQAIQILRGIKASRFEKPNRVLVDDDAIIHAVKLAKRYIPSKHLPEKAVALLDDAATRLRLTIDMSHPELDTAIRTLDGLKAEYAIAGEGEAKELLEKRIAVAAKELEEIRKIREGASKQKSVSVEDVADVVSELTRIPISKLDGDEKARLLNLPQSVGERVIGQKTAVQVVAKAVQRGRSGFASAGKPTSLMFLGTSGVGKTEICKALATEVYGDESAIIRLDMSEFAEKHNVARLIGSPPGYQGADQGGQLTNAVLQKPAALLLLDEAEKAHPDVFNILLQVLDDGRLSDAQGKLVDFKNTIIVMTSNIGSRIMLKSNEEHGRVTEDAKKLVDEEMKKIFRPEFLGRLDEVVMFDTLTLEDMSKICDLQLKPVHKMVQQKKMSMNVQPAAKQKLIEIGYKPQFGARPLRKAIQNHIQDPLTELYLEEKCGPGSVVDCVLENDKIVLKVR